MPNVPTMLGCVGDLLEDVVVQLLEDINVASDTESRVVHRRGGSAANVVEAACRAGGRARIIAQVGDDPTGVWVTQQLVDLGAEVCVRRAGRTGTIVVLVHPDGERTMLADRAACLALDEPDPAWLDGLDTLHLPYYSLVIDPLAATSVILAAWARERGIAVSVDTSSAALLEADGVELALVRINAVHPTVVLANEPEAAIFSDRLVPGELGGAIVVVKRGARPATVLRAGCDPVDVPAVELPGVRDTTGAGDAFAAGFLLALAQHGDPLEATRHGHEVAAAAVARASAMTD
ncbi:MAG: PfkB family carbohydrate kinase [Actinomycetota bacterium]